MTFEPPGVFDGDILETVVWPSDIDTVADGSGGISLALGITSRETGTQSGVDR
jgi:hypothetical protein